jgi:hypothetical protein
MSIALLLNAIGIISNLWFGASERNVATAICTLMFGFGAFVTLLITSHFTKSFGAYAPMSTLPAAVVKAGVWKILWTQNIITSCIAIPFIFVIRSAPSHPPSAAALALMEHKKTAPGEKPESKRVGPALKAICSNKNYLCVATGFIVVFSLYQAFGNLTGVIFGHYGFSIE